MSELQNAVEALTEPWSDVLSPAETGDGYKPVRYDALLDMLREAIHSSTGKTNSGRSAVESRNVMNVQAFERWETIDGETRAWITDLSRQQPKKDLKEAVVQLADLMQSLQASNQLELHRFERLERMILGWRKDIWSMFDPPVVKEILAPCPSCGEREYIAKEGGKQSAIVATYWRGLAPQAECRRCGGQWSGARELLRLGYSVAATVDEDALREMGVL